MVSFHCDKKVTKAVDEEKCETGRFLACMTEFPLPCQYSMEGQYREPGMKGQKICIGCVRTEVSKVWPNGDVR